MANIQPSTSDIQLSSPRRLPNCSLLTVHIQPSTPSHTLPPISPAVCPFVYSRISTPSPPSTAVHSQPSTQSSIPSCFSSCPLPVVCPFVHFQPFTPSHPLKAIHSQPFTESSTPSLSTSCHSKQSTTSHSPSRPQPAVHSQPSTHSHSPSHQLHAFQPAVTPNSPLPVIYPAVYPSFNYQPSTPSRPDPAVGPADHYHPIHPSNKPSTQVPAVHSQSQPCEDEGKLSSKLARCLAARCHFALPREKQKEYWYF